MFVVALFAGLLVVVVVILGLSKEKPQHEAICQVGSDPILQSRYESKKLLPSRARPVYGIQRDLLPPPWIIRCRGMCLGETNGHAWVGEEDVIVPEGKQVLCIE